MLQSIYSEKHFVYYICMNKMYIWINGYKVMKDKASFKLLTTVETFRFQNKILNI